MPSIKRKQQKAKMLPQLRILFLLTLICVALTNCSPQNETPTPTVSTNASPTPATIDFVGQPVQGSAPAVYRVMENGTVRHIADWPTFLALGYTSDQIISISDEKLQTYPVGPALTRWLLGQNSPQIYWLDKGKRTPISAETLRALGGNTSLLSVVADATLAQFPPAAEPLDTSDLPEIQEDAPSITDVLWHNSAFWMADASGALVRHHVKSGQREVITLPDHAVVTALAKTGNAILAGTNNGGLWRIDADGKFEQLNAQPAGKISALAGENEATIWYAHAHQIRSDLHIDHGIGLIARENDEERVLTIVPENGDDDPTRHILALAFDAQHDALWVGTKFGGVLRYARKTNTWQPFDAWHDGPADQIITDIKIAPDGAIWAATGFATYRFQDDVWKKQPIVESTMKAGVGALALAIAPNNAIYAAGEHFVAQRQPGKPWQVVSGFDHPLLDDRFERVVLDDENQPWFFGQKRVLHPQGSTWAAYDVALNLLAEFTVGEPVTGVKMPPRDFPSPTKQPHAWLQTWPRPANDNGQCVHFSNAFWFDEAEVQRNIQRMQRLGMRWTVYTYVTREQLLRAAPLFQAAGIGVVWRPFVRPFERYPFWAQDVAFLRGRGIPPYIQLYNEPSLGQEWDEAHPQNRDVYLKNLLPAMREVYAAGGYVGLQSIDPPELRVVLQEIKLAKLDNVFDRLFFVPHPYGLNHPPSYDEDSNSALGFRAYARVFEEEIGFTPMMIAGEGGWRPGEAQDTRYPAVSEVLHRDYHVAVYNWFRNGRLSNGEPLPDYLFAYCTWLLSDPNDPAAWFDSAAGNRNLLISEMAAAQPFTRRFSWEIVNKK